MSKVKGDIEFSEVPGKNIKTKVIVFMLVLGMVLVMLLVMFNRDKRNDTIAYKENCIGEFNTIICHQKKINELLKARDMENLNK